MNIKPMPVAQPSAPQASPAAADARARAIARLSEQPVPNANQVAPEEMSALKQPQNDTNTELEAQAPEVTEEVVQEAPKVEESESSQFAKLARREKAMRQQVQKQQQALRAQEEAIKAREAALAEKEAKYNTGYISKDRLKSNTFEALSEAEVSYDQIVQDYINNTSNPVDPRVNATISKLEAKIAALEAETQSTKKSMSDSQTQAYEAAVKQISLEAKQLVDSDPAYEVIKATNSVDDVVELIKRVHAEEGRLLSVEEAAEQVENYLLEESLKLAKLNKIRAKLSAGSTPAQSSKVQSPAPQASKQPQPMKTLTNAASGSRQLSARERALLAFKGEKY